MITFEKINLKPSYCLFNGIKHIDLNFLSINKKCIKNTDVVIHEIKYIIKQNIDNQNIDNELPLCLSFSDLNVYIIEENENKYLIFALTENNRKMLEVYKKLWSKIKKQIGCNSVEAINSSKCYFTESNEYEKDPMKIRFDSYDDDDNDDDDDDDDNDGLPLYKILCLSDLNIIVESVFHIKDKYHLQIHIHGCEYE